MSTMVSEHKLSDLLSTHGSFDRALQNAARRANARAVLFAAAALGACAGPALPPPLPPAQLAPPAAAYVVLGSGGQASARVVLAGDACPSLLVDGQSLPMQTRSAPGVAPLRAGQAKPAEFPLRVCEAALPAGARSARIGARALPLPAVTPQRIVVLGDTGCRIKQADHAFQDCSDAAAWPFRAVAEAAAREHPDLVVHVGDYHYRENACPAGAGCTGSPWGYGWDAWDADLFVPARDLLAAAPWVAARGNHEMCSRAGQGWFRLLDTAAPDTQRLCDAPGLDRDADFSAPYAVPLGGNWQLIVFDSARASQPLDRSRAADAQAYERYARDFAAVAALAAAPGMHSIFVSHHPVLGFGPGKGGVPAFGTPALLAPMQEQIGPGYFPAGVALALHGHVHTFEAISFASAHPATLVTGHGGDLLDREVPATLAASYASAPGVQIDFVAHAAGFGYLVLDRVAQGWQIRAQGIDGTVQARCLLADGHLTCPEHGALSRPQAAP